MNKWYIIQTRPRWEKKVADSLEQKGIESFFPVKKVRRKWSDRVKTIEEALFKSCLFVKISADQKTAVRLTDGVMNFVYQNGRPALVKEKDVRFFRKIAGQLEMNSVSTEVENGKQKKALLDYLDNFNHWLETCMERPKLV